MKETQGTVDEVEKIPKNLVKYDVLCCIKRSMDGFTKIFSPKNQPNIYSLNSSKTQNVYKDTININKTLLKWKRKVLIRKQSYTKTD